MKLNAEKSLMVNKGKRSVLGVNISAVDYAYMCRRLSRQRNKEDPAR